METITFKILQIKKLLMLLALGFSLHCATSLGISEEKKSAAVRSLETAGSAMFLEFPDTTNDSDPAITESFQKKINDRALLDELKKLILSGRENFTGSYAKRCLPVYSAAVVFSAPGGTETVMFSQQCKLLKFREKNIYLDFDKNAPRLENLFKRMRTN